MRNRRASFDTEWAGCSVLVWEEGRGRGKGREESPADHGVDSVFHWEPHLAGGLAGCRPVILTGERGRGQLGRKPGEESLDGTGERRARGTSQLAWAHLLALAFRINLSPRVAL